MLLGSPGIGSTCSIARSRPVTASEQRQQLRDGTLIVGPPKTDAGRRTLALPGPLVPEIVVHLDTYSLASPDALVFTGDKGGPLRYAVWQSIWAKARTAARWVCLTCISTT